MPLLESIWTDNTYIKGKFIYTDTQRGNIMWKQEKIVDKPQHIWSNQKLRETHGTFFLSLPSEGANPAETLVLDCKLPPLWDNTLLMLKQHSFWCFYVTASGNIFKAYLKHMNVSIQITIKETILILSITLKIKVAGLSAIESLCQFSIHVSKCFQYD